MSETLKKNLVSGVFWSVFGQVGYLFVALISNIILARLLGPEVFGQVGIIMVFIIVAKVLTESGFSGALIRKNDATHKDFTTVFIFNLLISLFLFVVYIFSAGYIAEFYNDPELENILIVTSLVLIINAFQITHNAKLVKDLKFKKKSIYQFVSIVIASVSSIIYAMNGGGVWAIIMMQILTALILTILLWVFEGNIGKLIFSKESFKELYKFGMYTTIASLLNSVFDNIYQLILAKYFSVSQTGLFYQAKKIQEMPVGIIKSATLGVVFSSLSKVQDDLIQFNTLYKRVITLFTIIVGLICILLYFYSHNIILLLYGEQWIEAVFYMKLLIIASFFYMQEMFNRIIFKVFNQTSKILFLEIIKKTIQSVTIIIGVVLMDLEILMYGFVFTSVVSYLINYYHTRKITKSDNWHELILVLKVVGVGIGTTLLLIILKNKTNLTGYNDFWLLPLTLIFYFGILKAFNMLNIIEESKLILELIRKKNVN